MPRIKKTYLRFSPYILCLISLAILVIAASLFARAGGGGGGSSGGGGAGGGGGGGGEAEIIWLIFRILLDPLIPWPLKIVLVGAIGSGGYFYVKMKSTQYSQRRVMGNITPVSEPKKIVGIEKVANLDNNELLQKARHAFIAIQKAWEKQNLSDVRRFISDGVYQRFNTQFKIMNVLKQKNSIQNVTVERIFIDRFEKDGDFDIAHICITATMKDRFICETIPSLNSEGDDRFTEYWSFIRKTGVPKKDMYATTNCPSCSAPLPNDLGETGKCGYCNTLINTGEFDWVLSEITQVDDYAGRQAMKKLPGFTKNITFIRKHFTDFSIQHVEDKASNGFLQIQTAILFKKPQIMRRFASDEAFTKAKAQIDRRPIVFNRLFLNDVSTIGAAIHNDYAELYIAVAFTMQRVVLKNATTAEILDPSLYTTRQVITLTRAMSSIRNKGSLYAHQCPTCGAQLTDSMDITCAYCQTALNSPAHEWIITTIMSLQEYHSFCKNQSHDEKKVSTKPLNLDELYNIKDYAFNNMIVVIGADGVFSDKEKAFAAQMAKKFGYKPQKIEELFLMARAGRLSIRMPEDKNARSKIFHLMERTASVDDNVTAGEKRLMAYMRKKYLTEAV